MFRFNFSILVLGQLLFFRPECTAQSKPKIEKQGTAAVSGQVRLNGEPLSDIKVVLRPEITTTPQYPRDIPQAQSDDHGIYRISGLVAGRYYISILTPGFIITGEQAFGSGGRALNLAADENLEGFDIDLKREGVISGRVSDSSNRPVARERVELIKLDKNGKPQPSPFNHFGPSMTDDHGTYRINRLPAGRYLVSVGVSLGDRESKEKWDYSSYQKTFFPGVTDQSKGRVVEVKEGSETAEVNISVGEAKKTYTINGRVIQAETGQPAAGVNIHYGTVLGDGRLVNGWMRSKEPANAEGEFQLQGFIPGKYSIFARARGEDELVGEPVACEIIESGIEGLQLKLWRGSVISGVVIIEGQNNQAVLARLTQNQIIGYNKPGQPFIPPRLPTKINADGSFLLTGLQPGKVNISLVINPVAGGFLMKRIEREGVPQPEGIEVGPGENLSNVRVVVGYGDFTLRGEVKVIGGTLPSYLGIYINAHRLNEFEPRTIGVSHVA